MLAAFVEAMVKERWLELQALGSARPFEDHDDTEHAPRSGRAPQRCTIRDGVNLQAVSLL
jgi:hypothetical protein